MNESNKLFVLATTYNVCPAEYNNRNEKKNGKIKKANTSWSWLLISALIFIFYIVVLMS